ncbi:GNAT family N-acetyltransferase [Salinicola halophilus]|uniref:GNAT family N-acetyltransferase n=1 Tax=Salinicola halophilus TaxID=184065 RepID=UPI000DA2610F|nr:GNAT family N-acetyltransferase [Salinicola halophilus]
MDYETERLRLRAPVASDAATVFRVYGDPVTNQFNPAGPHANPHVSERVLQGWLDHWRDYGFGIWAVVERAMPERVIGFGGLGWLEKEGLGSVLNLGYRFAPSAWGRGFATELGRGAVEYARERLDGEALFGLVRGDHEKSIRVLEKLGFAHFGFLDDVPDAAPSLVLRLPLHR